MKKSILVLALLTPLSLLAQGAANPVVTAAHAAVERSSHNLVAAAEEMPADKYNFSPTPQQMSFAKLVSHIAESNQFLCARLSGGEVPKVEVTEKDSKEKLVAAVKSSFEACNAVLGKLNDADLGQSVALWGGRQSTKAGALIALTSDLADHYGAAAMYLRLNGMLPPTAKKKGE